MIVEDVCKSGKWLRTVGSNPRRTTKAGSYYAEMNRRCNPELQVGKYASYSGCESYFTTFQEFAEWAMNQRCYGMNLDKDLLVKGNKVYSPTTCVFLPTELNNLITKCEGRRGDWPIGVSFDPLRGFKASAQNGEAKSHLGYFYTSEDAFNAYKVAKEQYMKLQAEKWKHQIDPRAYKALMEYEVEITD